MQNQLTTFSELERTHLRFLKVNDNKKLTEILQKLLQKLLMVYFEEDILSDLAFLENKKLIQLEEIMKHLMHKVQISKGEVQISIVQLIEIFSSIQYSNFTNQNIKNLAKGRIFDFIFAQYFAQRQQSQDQNVFDSQILESIIKAFQVLDDSSHEKSTLIVLFLHFLTKIQTKKEVTFIQNEINEIIKNLSKKEIDDESKLNKEKMIKNEILSCLFNFTCSVQQPECQDQSQHLMQQYFQQSLQFMHQNFCDTSKKILETFDSSVVQIFQTILKFLDHNQLFEAYLSVPLVVLLTMNKYGQIQDLSEIMLRSYFQDFDRNNQQIANNLYQILFNRNIYKIQEQVDYEQMQILGEEIQLPILTMKKIIEVLRKFDSSVQIEQGKNISKLVDICLKEQNHDSMIHVAMKFIMNVINTCKNLRLADNSDMNMIQRILHHLQMIRNLNDQENKDLFNQIAQAQVYICLADLAKYDYQLVFNSNEFSLSVISIEAFQFLCERMVQILNIKAVREDDICLILLEALNKFRDILDVQGGKDLNLESEKQILMRQVVKILNKELLKLSQQQLANNEIIYVLFLFVVTLDKSYHEDGSSQANPSVLFYAITLKENEDIKIRKEAQRQIDNFQKQINSFKISQNSGFQSSKDFLDQMYFLKQLQIETVNFFNRNNIKFQCSNEDFLQLINYSNSQNFQQNNFTLNFIDQCYEISIFFLDFFLEVYIESKIDFNFLDEKKIDQIQIQSETLQKILLFNLNLNFTKIKSNFIDSLKLIKKFIKKYKNNNYFEFLNDVAPLILYKHILATGEIDQQIQCLKILFQLTKNLRVNPSTNLFISQLNLSESNKENQSKVFSHEALLKEIIKQSLTVHLLQSVEVLQDKDQVDEQMIYSYKFLTEKVRNLIKDLKDSQFTPNYKIVCKLLCTCVNLLAQQTDLKDQFSEWSRELMQQTSELITIIIQTKNSDIPSFNNKVESHQQNIKKSLNVHLIKQLLRILLATKDDHLLREKCDDFLKLSIVKDCNEQQIYIGKFIARSAFYLISKDNNLLQSFLDNFLVALLKAQRDQKLEWSFQVPSSDKMEVQHSFDASLNSKRNCIIYLNEILQLYGETQDFMQEKFVQIQMLFLKYIFDMKPLVQEISSKALTFIYKIGNEQIKEALVQSLSQVLTVDEGKMNQDNQINSLKNEENLEDKELMLNVIDGPQNAEQNKKLKTYKDLCKIAIEIGQKDMIYQFMEVHRHLSHYQDVKNAAQGLSSIVKIMLDSKLKQQLMKIIPKILLLTYDYNQDVRDTMKQLWSSLVDVDKESQLIEEKWPEILDLCLDYMKQKEFRKRLSACLVLCDLIPNRSWTQIKSKFRELFLGSLNLLDDDVEAIKNAGVDLAKANKKIILKHANIYNNTNLEELREVLDLVIPAIQDDILKSNIKKAKYYGVNILFEIVKSSTQERMYQKIQDKYERQLAFSYNSDEQMKEILRKYLPSIILNVMENLSMMNDAVAKINQIEQYAIDKGFYQSSQSQQDEEQKKISDKDINDLRVKYTQESEWGKILSICRKQMSESIFDQILNELLNLMIRGHDMITKSSAVIFIQDIILENKIELISPKNARKIAQRLIEVYQQNSIQTCLQLKLPLVQLYASCLGLLFKIIRAFKETTQNLIQQIVELPEELEFIKTANIYEIVKNLQSDQFRSGGSDGDVIIKNAVPMIFINRYQSQDLKLKNASLQLWRYINELMVEASDESYLQNHSLEIQNSEKIMERILQLFESNSYDDRISAGQAMEELAQKLQSDEIANSIAAKNIIQKLISLISGKYFVKKEILLGSFTQILGLMENHNPFLTDKNQTQEFLSQVYLKQLDKFQNQNLEFKNKLIECVNKNILIPNYQKYKIKGSEPIQQIQLEDITSLIIIQLEGLLQKISEDFSSKEQAGVKGSYSFDEKKDEEKQILTTVSNFCEQFSILWNQLESIQDQNFVQTYVQLCKKYYSFTNFYVRNSFLKSVLSYMKIQKQCGVKISEQAYILVDHILSQVAQKGEKFEMNLEILSEICVNIQIVDIQGSLSDNISKNSQELVKILKEKGGDQLLKNVDIIKTNLFQ